MNLNRDGVGVSGETLNLKTMELELMERVRMFNEDKRQLRRRRRRCSWSNASSTSCSVETSAGQPMTSTSGSGQPIPTGLPDWEPVELPAEPEEKQQQQSWSKKRREKSDIPAVIADDELEKNRLSSEEILKLAKFKDYEPGEPSNVLYIKNLSNATSESDLMAIFGRYDNVKNYRLMSGGKMRGQAFVTFSDVDVASKALKFLHGVLWKGKPMVIEYGRQKKK